MVITNNSSRYSVGDLVASTSKYRMYLCKQEGRDGECLLQISDEAVGNGALDRNALLLKELKNRADALEKEYAKVKKNPEAVLNYDLGFPELVDTFICKEQGQRRVNVIAFRSVEDVSNLVPLINLPKKDFLRVDLRTSAWIMGKLLKLLTFVHGENISIGSLGASNILIEPNRRYVVIFDWVLAQLHSGVLPIEIRAKEISEAAKAVINVLGGDWRKGIIPKDESEDVDRYIDFLLLLARANESNAERAHKRFYEIVDSIWKKEFYPFTTKPLN